MARIPTSEPQPTQRAGSVGVQPDINIGSNVFAAIRGAARDIQGAVERNQQAEERLKAEAQASIDRTALYKATRLNRGLSGEISQSIQDAGIQNDPQEWSETIDKSIEASNEAYQRALDGVSEETRERLEFEREFQTQEARSRMIGQAAAQIEENENAAGLALATGLIGEGDTEGALEVVNGLQMSEAEKIKHKTRLKSQADSIAYSDINFSISSSTNIAELKDSRSAIEESGLSQVQKNALNKNTITRERQIRSDAYTEANNFFKLHDSAAHETLTGQIPDKETLRKRGLDEGFIDNVLGPIIEGQSGQTSANSEAFSALKEQISEYNAKAWFGSDQEDRDKLMNAVKSSDWDFDARLQAGALIAQSFASDAADGVIGMKNSEMELDDGQKEVYANIQKGIFDRIRGSVKIGRDADFEKIAFEKSLLSPDQMVSLFDQFSDPMFIGQFGGKSEEERQKLFEEQVQPRFVNAIKNSIQFQLREELERIKPARP